MRCLLQVASAVPGLGWAGQESRNGVTLVLPSSSRSTAGTASGGLGFLSCNNGHCNGIHLVGLQQTNDFTSMKLAAKSPAQSECPVNVKRLLLHKI